MGRGTYFRYSHPRQQMLLQVNIFEMKDLSLSYTTRVQTSVQAVAVHCKG